MCILKILHWEFCPLFIHFSVSENFHWEKWLDHNSRIYFQAPQPLIDNWLKKERHSVDNECSETRMKQCECQSSLWFFYTLISWQTSGRRFFLRIFTHYTWQAHKVILGCWIIKPKYVSTSRITLGRISLKPRTGSPVAWLDYRTNNLSRFLLVLF